MIFAPRLPNRLCDRLRAPVSQPQADDDRDEHRLQRDRRRERDEVLGIERARSPGRGSARGAW